MAELPETDAAFSSEWTIRVVGARVHNLQSVSVDIPKGKLICMTGVSGSGKSSLAFDTLFAEGQRRYLESLSSYARQFLGELPKPDVDQVTGLSPAISIQQKTSGWNPRSTVGTITQIHDYLRVLFARAGDAHCPQCSRAITAQTREQMLARILLLPADRPLLILAPKVRGQKGEHRDLIDELLRRGFARARIDGEIFDLNNPPSLDRNRRHDIEAVIDRVVPKAENRARLAEALDLALSEGAGSAIVRPIDPPSAAAAAPAETPKSEEPAAEAALAAAKSSGRKSKKKAVVVEAEIEPEGPPPAQPAVAAASADILLSSAYACTHCQLSFEPPSPQLFSFNSPQGMCPGCDGLGTRFDFDADLLVPDPSLSFLAPCVAPLRTKPGRWARHFYEGVAKHVGFDLKKPWRDLPKAARDALLFGLGDTHVTFEWRGRHGAWKHGGTFAGVVAELHDKYKRAESTMVRSYYEQFMRSRECPQCRGARLVPQALSVTLRGKPEADGPAIALNLHEACKLSIDRAHTFFQTLELQGIRARIGEEPLKEIRARLRFLLDVGLNYLSLDRSAPTLSGGESQRIRLASQIGAGLVGVLYVLDEPSIGLHPRDNLRLLQSLQRLRDLGNTVIVVEHDLDTMRAADFIVDFGPGAGVRGGRVLAAGDIACVSAAEESITGAYLSGRREIEIPAARRPIASTPPKAAANAKKSAPRRRPVAASEKPVAAGEDD